jgi:biopolymer transport protein ExbB
MTKLFKSLLIICVMGLILSSTAQAWWNDAWTQRKKITVDASSAGGAITDPIGTTPILIRLHDGDFQFASARDDGSDLRFVAADDKTLLTYHIEKYDSLLGEAFVWVRVPDLKPGAQVSFWLYYGNTGDMAAPGGADAKGTYDADTVLVYHFSEIGKPVHDFTETGNDAQNAGVLTDGSLIGSGLRLDGKSLITIPASASLAWSEESALTWSAWIKLGVLQPNAPIFSRRDGGNAFLIGADNGVPFVEVNGSRSPGGAPLAAETWHHLAVVASGSQITLYLDGVSYATLNAGIPALNSPSLIGGDASDAGGTVGLVGEMDELEISKVARPPGFIKLAAGEQGVDSGRLLTVAQDEQPATGWLSGAFGLFGVVFKSVTIDGWVVIGVLAIMSVVSWLVMIGKLLYLNRIEKGNALFLEEWRQVARDLTALDHRDGELIKSMGGRINPKVQKLVRRSPLYHIYHIGSEEIGHRQAGDKILSSQSIQAIRASLDSGYVHENHRLNSGMVFLTISIAGGPFLGLLGTVVGVMITFAAIAATGEVNISAIAPGLAAALVATVAGLLVAIPALLGYNYLVSRIKNVTSDMQIFVDEFVTKMAEFYSPATTAGATDGMQALVDQLIQALSEHNERSSNGVQTRPVNH